MSAKWYVIQVLSGKEQRVCDLIIAHAKRIGILGGPILGECFVPQVQMERKFHGEWRILERPLFPGYVVALSSRIEALNLMLGKLPTLTRILGSESSFVPLDPAEQALISKLSTGPMRTVLMSRAIKEGGSVVVTEGPLVGHEGEIVRIDRRHGTCRLRFEAFGRELEVELGLAIVG